MIVNSLRLGQIEVPGEKVIHMAKPILGFEHLLDFCLVEVEELKPFLWLQAVDDSAISFLVANPRLFKEDYKIEINPKEVAELNIIDSDAVETYVILNFDEDANKMSANLQGPILINTENNRGKQLVLVNSDYQVKYALFDQTTETTETDSKPERTPIEV